MYQCQLGQLYIREDAELLHHPLFKSGVSKIQNGITEMMTDGEKEASEKLHVNDNDNSTGFDREGEIEYKEQL